MSLITSPKRNEFAIETLARSEYQWQNQRLERNSRIHILSTIVHQHIAHKVGHWFTENTDHEILLCWVTDYLRNNEHLLWCQVLRDLSMSGNQWEDDFQTIFFWRMAAIQWGTTTTTTRNVANPGQIEHIGNSNNWKQDLIKELSWLKWLKRMISSVNLCSIDQ